MSKSNTSDVSVLARGNEAEFYTVAEIEASLPAWRIDGIELTEREMNERRIPIPRDGVDGWQVRQARVMIGDATRVCRVWSKRKA